MASLVLAKYLKLMAFLLACLGPSDNEKLRNLPMQRGLRGSCAALSKTRESVVGFTFSFVLFSVFNALLETTPGVYQASGYGDLTEKESIWCNCFIILRSGSYLLQVLVFFSSRKS